MNPEITKQPASGTGKRHGHAGRQLRNGRTGSGLKLADLALSRSLSRELQKIGEMLTVHPALRELIASIKGSGDIESIGSLVVTEIEKSRSLPKKIVNVYRRAIKERLEFRDRISREKVFAVEDDRDRAATAALDAGCESLGKAVMAFERYLKNRDALLIVSDIEDAKKTVNIIRMEAEAFVRQLEGDEARPLRCRTASEPSGLN